MTFTLASIEWSEGIEDAWAAVARFVPKFIGFLLVLLIGYFIAKAIAKVADAALERLGFDRAVERGGVKQALDRSQYDASDLVAKLIFYTLLLLVLQMAFGIFGPNPVSDMISGVVAYLPKVLVAIIIVVLATALAAAARELIAASLGGLDYGKMLGNIAGVAIVTVGVFAALNQLQIAPAIVNGLFYAVLALVVGSSIVAIGGGGIRPMQERWEKTLAKYDEEKPKVRHEMQGARARIAERTEQLTATSDSSRGTDGQAGARALRPEGER